jgi:phytoene desaturase
MRKENKGTALIIGSGIAGLACAIRLVHKGYQVKVFEANPYPGGKLSELVIKNYRFDAGPSLFTLPEQVEELFKITGLDPKDHFTYQKLDITCNYFYEDGTRITAFADKEKLVKEINEKTGEDTKSIEDNLNKSAYLYNTLSGLFMHRSLHKLKTFFNKDALKAYFRMHKLDFFRSMHQANKADFKDPRVVQLFNRYATYNGSNPYEAPATLRIIPHLEFNIGAFFPDKGMHDITLSLFKLAKSLGVEFHFSSKVDEIIIASKKAVGIKTVNSTYTGDLIISNMDMVNTYRKLMPTFKAPEKLLTQPKSSSALIFYWGIKKSFSQLSLHNIFFSKDYEKEFTSIFKNKSIHDDPTVYINITSKLKNDDAPSGCENWFTMINVPHNEGQDWDKLIAESRIAIIKKLSRILNEDIESLIEAEEYLDPRKIESKTSSFGGALYGNSSNNKYAAFLRHSNFSNDFKNLYFCGGSVHPGGGIPLCLLSAKITADLIP